MYLLMDWNILVSWLTWLISLMNNSNLLYFQYNSQGLFPFRLALASVGIQHTLRVVLSFCSLSRSTETLTLASKSYCTLWNRIFSVGRVFCVFPKFTSLFYLGEMSKKLLATCWDCAQDAGNRARKLLGFWLL